MNATTTPPPCGLGGDCADDHPQQHQEQHDDDVEVIRSWSPALGESVNVTTPKSPGNVPMDVADKNNHGWRRVVRNFTPSWFTVTMGTGIVSILLFNFPYNASWLYWLSVIVFVLNITLFVLGSLISILRYTLWPEIWGVMIHHPNQALFVGAIPMSLGTIVSMIVLVCVPAWGDWAAYLAWGLWIADAVMSMICAIYMPFLLIKQKSESSLSTITALQLFPVVTTVVAAASGGIVAEVLPNPQQALATIVAGYILWGIGAPTAMVILVIYFHRLAIHKMPPREVIVSSFLPLGPLNMGSFALIQLGADAMKVFPQTKTIHPLAGDVMYILGVVISFVLWGFSLLWMFMAVASIYHCKKFPFNMGWWGFTFPLGTFALLCDKLAIELPSTFFRVIGSISSVAVFLLWIIVASATIKDLFSGESKLLNAPCLKELERKNSSESDSTELKDV